MAGKRLVGGSKGEPEKTFTHGFVHPNIKAEQVVVKKVYGGRFLPAFDYDLLNNGRVTAQDPKFLHSYIPYRDKDNIVPDTKQPAFTSWYFLVSGHTFIGKDRRSFLSPLTTEGRYAKGIDPLLDIAIYAKNHPEHKRLLEKPTGKGEYAPLTWPKQFALCNWLMEIEPGKNETRLLIFTKQSLQELKDSLDTYAPRDSEIISPEWPKYLLGDITHPMQGLWCHAERTVFGEAGMETVIFKFSQDPRALVGHKKYPIDPNTAEGKAVLASRYDLQDTDNVVRIPSKEEILEYVVASGHLPYALIQLACDKHYDIPKEGTKQTVYPGAPAEPEDDVPMDYTKKEDTVSTPVEQPFPKEKEEPVQTTADNIKALNLDRKFWLFHNGDIVEKSGSEILALLAKGVTGEFKVVPMDVDPAPDWADPGVYSLAVATPPPKPPAPPKPPEPPKPPKAPKAPKASAAPKAPVAPAAPVAGSAGLTAEEQTEYMKLSTTLVNDGANALSKAEDARLQELSKKIGH